MRDDIIMMLEQLEVLVRYLLKAEDVLAYWDESEQEILLEVYFFTAEYVILRMPYGLLQKTMAILKTLKTEDNNGKIGNIYKKC